MRRGGYDCKDKGKLSDIYAKEVSDIKNYYKGISEETIREKIGDHLLKKSENLQQLIKDALLHLKRDPGRKKTIVFLDNVDQKQTHLQREIYAFARELMSLWGVDASVITMTPIAFHNARYDRTERSPRSIGHTKVYTIISPPVSSILQKRIDFIQTLYKEERLPSYGFDFSVHNVDAYDYLSFLRRELAPNKMISCYMESLAGGNIREVIDMLQIYIVSPWTKVVKWNADNKAYEVIDEVTRSRFLRAILRNNALDYDPETNQFIVNLFNLNELDPREHFLALAILHKLQTTTPSGSTYHSVKDILEWGTGLFNAPRFHCTPIICRGSGHYRRGRP